MGCIEMIKLIFIECRLFFRRVGSVEYVERQLRKFVPLIEKLPFGKHLKELLRYFYHALKGSGKLREVTMSNYALDPNKLNIAIVITGGIGDICVSSNYVHAFAGKFAMPETVIDVFAHTNQKVSQAFFKENTVIRKVLTKKEISLDNKSYDCLIYLNRYPDVRFRNLKKIALFNDKLLTYIFEIEKNRLRNIDVFDNNPRLDGNIGAISEILGKKRIQQPDIGGVLGITENFSYVAPIEIDEDACLAQFKLKKNCFITLNRSVDDNCEFREVNKLWPKEKYEELAIKLKTKYPSVKLVQLGSLKNKSNIINGMDLNLLGKTTLHQLKVLLKNSVMHIDAEGGMVHIRAMLSEGKSCVLFGPTSEKIYGYEKNINIRGDGCSMWCEWVLDRWYGVCCRGYDIPAPCMASISVERVLTEIIEYFERSKVMEHV